MFEITKPSENRVDIKINGQITSDEMAQGLDALIAQSEGMKEGTSLYTLTGFAMPTLGAISVEMSRLPKLFGLIGKISRCAVVTDQKWVRTAAEIEGALIPGLVIKAFAPDEVAAAEAWLSEA